MRFIGWVPRRAAARRRAEVAPEPVAPEAAGGAEDPAPADVAPSGFVVRRMDDHGNVYDVGRHATRDEAQTRADELEARAHKQTYWVTELPE